MANPFRFVYARLVTMLYTVKYVHTRRRTQRHISLLVFLHILCQTPIFINQVCAQFNKKILTYKWFFIKTPFVLGIHASLPPLLLQPLWKENPPPLPKFSHGRITDDHSQGETNWKSMQVAPTKWEWGIRWGGVAATLPGQTAGGANTQVQRKLSPGCLLPPTHFIYCVQIGWDQ